MNVLDVNVLVALFRPDHSHHDAARAWWARSAAAGESFTVPDIAWVGFCRLVTNPRVVSVPATFDQAREFVEQMSRAETYLVFAADSRILAEFLRLGVDSRIGTALVTDAYLAATALTLGATMVTFDRDFRRFDGLRVHEPALAELIPYGE